MKTHELEGHYRVTVQGESELGNVVVGPKIVERTPDKLAAAVFVILENPELFIPGSVFIAEVVSTEKSVRFSGIVETETTPFRRIN